MIGIKVKVDMDTKPLMRKIEKAKLDSLGRSGAYIRKIAQNRIKVRPSERKKQKGKTNTTKKQRMALNEKLRDSYDYVSDDNRDFYNSFKAKYESYMQGGREASKPGQAPYTSSRRQLKKAIRFNVENKYKDNVVVGTHYGFLSDVGMAHEIGGTFRGKKYPTGSRARKFMYPSLMDAKPRLPQKWQNSIK